MNTSTTTPRNGAASGATEQSGIPTFTPPVDVHETEQEFVVSADMPGVQPDAIDVRYADGALTIDAPAAGRRPAGARSLVAEYGVGPFHRSFRLGEGVDASGVRAEYLDGVLTLRLPKSKGAQPRRIQVQTR